MSIAAELHKFAMEDISSRKVDIEKKLLDVSAVEISTRSREFLYWFIKFMFPLVCAGAKQAFDVEGKSNKG